MLRTDETEDDVDLRPRSPPGPDEWRKEDRGVAGAGDKEDRLRGVGICGRM